MLEETNASWRVRVPGLLQVYAQENIWNMDETEYYLTGIMYIENNNNNANLDDVF